VIQTPYLILSRTAKNLVRKLRQEHPELSIRISTNSYASTDNILAYSANYRLRGDYVDKLKLEVHEFKPRPESLHDIFPQYDRVASRAETPQAPFLCIHAKSLVVDDHLSFVGSYNLDPRSESLNTEVGLLIEDEAFAMALKTEIERDMRAANSWVIARREIPLVLDTVNTLIDGILSISPVDVWPIQNTSTFELKPGQEEVPPDDPRFYQNYRDAGVFPGTDGFLTTKDILTRLYKVVGAPLTPVM
jgi:cardiolipin synthase C